MILLSLSWAAKGLLQVRARFVAVSPLPVTDGEQVLRVTAYVVKEGGAVGERGTGHRLGSASRRLGAFRHRLVTGASVQVHFVLYEAVADGRASSNPVARVTAELQYTQPQLQGSIQPEAMPSEAPALAPEHAFASPQSSPRGLQLLATTPRSRDIKAANAALTPLQASPPWWQAFADGDVSVAAVGRRASALPALAAHQLALALQADPQLLTPPNLASLAVRALMKSMKRSAALVRSPVEAVGDFGDAALPTAGQPKKVRSAYACDAQWLRLGIRRGCLMGHVASAQRSGVFRVRCSVSGLPVGGGWHEAVTQGAALTPDGALSWDTPLVLQLPREVDEDSTLVDISLQEVAVGASAPPPPLTASLRLAQLPGTATSSTILTWRGGEGGVFTAALWLVAHRTQAAQQVTPTGTGGSGRGTEPVGIEPTPQRLVALPSTLAGPQQASEGKESKEDVQDGSAPLSAPLTTQALLVPPALLPAAAALAQQRSALASAEFPTAAPSASSKHAAYTEHVLQAMAGALQTTLGTVNMATGMVQFCCVHAGASYATNGNRALWSPPPSLQAATAGTVMAPWTEAVRGGGLAPQAGLLPSTSLPGQAVPLLGAGAEWALTPTPPTTTPQDADPSQDTPATPPPPDVGWAVPDTLWQGGGVSSGLAQWGLLVTTFADSAPGAASASLLDLPAATSEAFPRLAAALLPSKPTALACVALSRARTAGQATGTSDAALQAQAQAALASAGSALGLPKAMLPAVLLLRPPAVGGSGATTPGRTRKDTVQAMKTTGVYPGLLAGSTSACPAMTPSGRHGTLGLSVWAWPGYEPPPWDSGRSDGAGAGGSAAESKDAAAAALIATTPAPTNQGLRRERALASALAAEHAARAAAAPVVVEVQAALGEAATQGAAVPVMPLSAVQALSPAPLPPLGAPSRPASRPASHRSSHSSALSAPGSSRADSSRLDTPPTREARSGGGVSPSPPPPASGLHDEAAAPTPVPGTPSGGKEQEDAESVCPPPPASPGHRSPSPLQPLPAALRGPPSPRTAQALASWDFAFLRAEHRDTAAKRTIVHLMFEVQRLSAALQEAGEDIVSLRQQLEAEQSAAAARAATSSKSKQVQDAALRGEETALLRKVARVVTAERPVLEGGRRGLPPGALGLELKRSEMKQAIQILARRLAETTRRLKAASAGQTALAPAVGSELPSATQLQALDRPDTAASTTPAGARAALQKLHAQHVALQKAHFKQNRFVQSLQTRLSKVELLRTTVKTQESVINKLQRWIEHKLELQHRMSSRPQTQAAPEEGSLAALLQARDLRIRVLEEQLVENAQRFSEQLSGLKIQLMEAEAGDEGSVEHGGGGHGSSGGEGDSDLEDEWQDTDTFLPTTGRSGGLGSEWSPTGLASGSTRGKSGH